LTSPASLDILFEDNHVIVINKKASEIVQGDKTGDETLPDKIKAYLKEKYQKPGEVFMGVIHRIDRPVSGLVLMARTSKALERMNEQFKNREIEKKYLAVVRNRPPANAGNLVHWLIKNPETNVTKAYEKEVPNSMRSELNYKLIGELDGFYLLDVNPITGRPHQIRVQLASMNCPIVGDNKYGYPRGNKDKSICLHAHQVKFMHPVKKEEMQLFAALPLDSFWQKFLPLIKQ
jgi:23S rRNA pseudouridine1911/1915/1917 synthase